MKRLKPHIPALLVGILLGVTLTWVPMSYSVTDAEKHGDRMAVAASAYHTALKLAGVPVKE